MSTKTNVGKNINVKNQGSGNGRWTGGLNTHYVNHYQRKLNRKERLKQCDNKCEKCGTSNVILNASSFDGDKNNHDITNLRMLCSKCMGCKQNSKYKKVYGNTLKELSHKYGVSLYLLYGKFIHNCPTKTTMINALVKHNEEKFGKDL